MRPQNLIISFFSPNVIYKFATIFPFVSILICWSIYYSTGHFKKGRIRTISETVMFYPESLIFLVTMNVESILFLLIFYVRQKMLKKLAEVKKISEEKGFKLALSMSNILAIVISAGLSVTSSFTLKENKLIHLSGAMCFFFGIISYFLITDYFGRKVGFTISSKSYSLPYITVFFAVIFVLTTVIFQRNRTIYSLGSLSEYIAAILIFVKIYLLQYEAPPHTLLNGNEQHKFE